MARNLLVAWHVKDHRRCLHCTVHRDGAMSKERGRRRYPRIRTQAPAAKAQPVRIHLASGVRLDGTRERSAAWVLVSPDGKVQLNEAAVSILRLCDGSRTRDDIVAAVTHRPHGASLAADVGEFLDIARARGWIIEI